MKRRANGFKTLLLLGVAGVAFLASSNHVKVHALDWTTRTSTECTSNIFCKNIFTETDQTLFESYLDKAKTYGVPSDNVKKLWNEIWDSAKNHYDAEKGTSFFDVDNTPLEKLNDVLPLMSRINSEVLNQFETNFNTLVKKANEDKAVWIDESKLNKTSFKNLSESFLTLFNKQIQLVPSVTGVINQDNKLKQSDADAFLQTTFIPLLINDVEKSDFSKSTIFLENMKKYIESSKIVFSDDAISHYNLVISKLESISSIAKRISGVSSDSAKIEKFNELTKSIKELLNDKNLTPSGKVIKVAQTTRVDQSALTLDALLNTKLINVLPSLTTKQGPSATSPKGNQIYQYDDLFKLYNKVGGTVDYFKSMIEISQKLSDNWGTEVKNVGLFDSLSSQIAKYSKQVMLNDLSKIVPTTKTDKLTWFYIPSDSVFKMKNNNSNPIKNTQNVALVSRKISTSKLDSKGLPVVNKSSSINIKPTTFANSLNIPTSSINKLVTSPDSLISPKNNTKIAKIDSEKIGKNSLAGKLENSNSKLKKVGSLTNGKIEFNDDFADQAKSIIPYLIAAVIFVVSIILGGSIYKLKKDRKNKITL